VDRLFLDANVLFSAAYRDGAGVARLWHLRDVALVTSEYAIEEAQRNLPDADQRERLETLLKTVERLPTTSLDPSARRGIALREKDWPILAGAVAGSATHLVTGDVRDFGRYFGQVLFGILVLTPADYLRSRA
jgi:predicted nucleic acid-binding protein